MAQMKPKNTDHYANMDDRVQACIENSNYIGAAMALNNAANSLSRGRFDARAKEFYARAVVAFEASSYDHDAGDTQEERLSWRRFCLVRALICAENAGLEEKTEDLKRELRGILRII